MERLKKILCLFVALSALTVVGCGDNDEDSSSIDKSSSQSESKADESSEIKKQEMLVGEHLKNSAKIYESGKYTLKCPISGDAIGTTLKLTRVVNEGNVYQLQEEKAGSYGVISVNGEAYAFDNNCGMYKSAKSAPDKSIVEEIIEQNIPVKNTSESKDKKYVTEQYTYTGDTYITNVTFYFDKNTDELKKYEMKYTVEGQDDATETRVINSISDKVDESVFKLDFLKKMVNFDTMSEEQKMGFCQGVCVSRGINEQMLSDYGIKSEDFKKIEFDTFFDLIYSYNDKD